MDSKKPTCLKNGDTLKYINIFTQKKKATIYSKNKHIGAFQISDNSEKIQMHILTFSNIPALQSVSTCPQKNKGQLFTQEKNIRTFRIGQYLRKIQKNNLQICEVEISINGHVMHFL